MIDKPEQGDLYEESVTLLVARCGGEGSDERAFPPDSVVRVGRSPEADIEVDSSIRRVSREHATIAFESGAWVFRNHSRRGTMHGGQPVKELVLPQAAELWLGDAEGGTPLALRIEQRPRLLPAEAARQFAELDESAPPTAREFLRGSLAFLRSHLLLTGAVFLGSVLLVLLTNSWMTTVRYDGERYVPEDVPLFTTSFNTGSTNLGAYAFWFLLAALLGWMAGYAARTGPRRFLLDMLRSPVALVRLVSVDWPSGVTPFLVGTSVGLVLSVWMLPLLSVLAALILMLVLPSLLGYQLAGLVEAVWRGGVRAIGRAGREESLRHPSAAALVGVGAGLASSLVIVDPVTKLVLAAVAAIAVTLSMLGLLRRNAAGCWLGIGLVGVAIGVALEGLDPSFAWADDGGASECSAWKPRSFWSDPFGYLRDLWDCGGSFNKDIPWVEVVPAVPGGVGTGGESPPSHAGPPGPAGPPRDTEWKREWGPNPDDYDTLEEWNEAAGRWERRQIFQEIFEDRLDDPVVHFWLDENDRLWPAYPNWYPLPEEPAPRPRPRPKPKRRRPARPRAGPPPRPGGSGGVVPW